MVAVYVDGERVGTVEENGDVLARLVEAGRTVELRADGGRKLATVQPEPICPWEPGLTEEELDRRAAEPGGMTLAEFYQSWRRA